ncbi:MAG: hypothetical protein WEC79_07190 [Thermomicrobiales bacterium]
MNLTTTRAAQTACAEPGFASRRSCWAATIELNSEWSAPVACERATPANDDRPSAQPITSESERFGLVLLGIGFDSSVA